MARAALPILSAAPPWSTARRDTPRVREPGRETGQSAVSVISSVRVMLLLLQADPTFRPRVTGTMRHIAYHACPALWTPPGPTGCNTRTAVETHHCDGRQTGHLAVRTHQSLTGKRTDIESSSANDHVEPSNIDSVPWMLVVVMPSPVPSRVVSLAGA